MSTHTAVVIDDEPDVAEYLATILEEQGFTVRTAADATSGEALVREAPPDLILIDLMMPGRSGVQLLSRLRGDDTTRHIPLVMVTGIKDQMGIDWSQIVDGLRARKPDGFVEKPIDSDALMRVVNDVMAGKSKNGKVVHG